MMRKPMKIWAAGLSLFLLVATNLRAAQAPAQSTGDKSAEQATAEQATGTPDHAAAYYHYMLAQRYKELAGIYNRGDYVDRAISEYKKAIEADPASLFLRVELAGLYWRATRLQDAINEAQAVLKVNPNQVEAHRLLAHIYLGSLSNSKSDAATHDVLQKTIAEFEAVTRLDSSDLESALILGRLYKVNNEPQKAEAIFKQVLQDKPDSRSVLVNLTQLYFDQGDYQKIIDLLKGIPDGRMDPSLLYLLGSAYMQTRNLDAAENTYEVALKREPENQDIRRAYSEALMAHGKMQQARDQLEEILKVTPDDASTYLRLGQLDREMGRFDDARQEFERAKSLAPGNLEVPYQEALLEDTLGHEDKAVALLEDLLKKTAKPDGKYNPAEANNRSVFLQRLGMIYRSQEKYPKAIETFRRIVALGEDQAPRGEALIVETYQLNRQPEKALAEVSEAIQKYPHNRQLLIQHASLLGEQGHRDEAVKQLRGMLNNTPEDRELYLAIAQIYSQGKSYTKAEAVIQKALALSNSPDDQEYARFMLGSVYERMKKYDLAEEQFKKVLAVDPLNDAAANYLGYMLADQGVRLEESVKYIERALRLEPNNGAYLDSLGWAYYKMNRYERAEAPLQKAVQLISNDPTVREHLGYVYLALGKKVEAQREWEHALKVWHKTSASDFGPEQAAKLRKKLNQLKHELGNQESSADQK
ncbi:MAG TPA: tetratricopeptide repeat protein [Terriglobia bacterium]|nr:tetratricopeptide repeat protein [Terriglobia bacterium]